MAKTKFYLDTRRMKKDGTYPLRIDVCKDSTTCSIRLNVSLHPEEWDSKEKMVINRPDEEDLNMYIYSYKYDIDKILREFIRLGTTRTCTVLELKEMIEDKLYQGQKEKTIDITRFSPTYCKYTNRYNRRTTEVGDELAHSNNATRRYITYFYSTYYEYTNLRTGRTREIYEATYKHLQKFAGQKLKKLRFEDITTDWLGQFNRYLLDVSPSKNARNIHFRNIRAVFNYAIDNDITTNYPFHKFVIKDEETPKRSLTVEQLRTLFNYPCEDWQQPYVDIFKLTFFLCGINIIDLFNLKEIFNGRVEYKRAKTHKIYSIKVEPEALEIINKYRGEKALLNMADRYSNYKDYAKRLNYTIQHLGEYKRVGRGGKKVYTPLFPNITTYWMRHSWATIAAKLDIPKETIAEGLGHEMGNQTTAIYINFNEEKVDEANRKVIDYVQYDKK